MLYVTLRIGETGWVKSFWAGRLASKPCEEVPGCQGELWFWGIGECEPDNFLPSLRAVLMQVDCFGTEGLSLWDPAGRKQALHSLSLGLEAVSSAVVPRCFVPKRCSLKANTLTLSEEFR